MFFAQQDLPPIVQQQTATGIAKHVERVEGVVALLTGEDVEQMDALRSAVKLGKVVRVLKQRAAQEAKYRDMVAGLEGRRRETRREMAEVSPKLEAMLTFSRKVKRDLEAVLSKQYNGRPVNVIGAINTVLAGGVGGGA